MASNKARFAGDLALPASCTFTHFDPLAADLIHVHLYDHLLTGESLIKTHVLPCDAVLLNGCERIGNVQVPAKEAEAALCVLRSCIKNGSLLHTLLHGSGRSADEPNEFWFADEGIDAAAAYAALQPHYNAVDERLFSQCFQALAEDQSALKKWILGLKMRRCLRGCARHTYLGRLTAYAGLVFAKIRRIVHGKIKNKVPSSGGAVIAFIGGDATGKSTLVGETTKWLGGTFGDPHCACRKTTFNLDHCTAGHPVAVGTQCVSRPTSPDTASSRGVTAIVVQRRRVQTLGITFVRAPCRVVGMGPVTVITQSPSSSSGG